MHQMAKAMATKKTSPVHRKTRSTVTHQPTAYDHLHALLHTVRCIAQYEDVLCEITHEAKQSGELSPKLGSELGEILDKMPSHAYVSDLDAVRTTIVASKASAESRPTRPTKSVTSGKPLPSKKSR